MPEQVVKRNRGSNRWEERRPRTEIVKQRERLLRPEFYYIFDDEHSFAMLQNTSRYMEDRGSGWGLPVKVVR